MERAQLVGLRSLAPVLDGWRLFVGRDRHPPRPRGDEGRVEGTENEDRPREGVSE